MRHRARRSGFVLPSAIFLLVILAALGAFILNISSQQQLGSALDISGERAYQAAHAGMEWARYQVWNNSACPANTPWNGSQTTLTFPGTQTLSAFSVSVECNSLQTTDVGVDNLGVVISTTVFEIRVTACNKPQVNQPKCPPADPVANNPNPNSSSLGYVERQLDGLISL